MTVVQTSSFAISKPGKYYHPPYFHLPTIWKLSLHFHLTGQPFITVQLQLKQYLIPYPNSGIAYAVYRSTLTTVLWGKPTRYTMPIYKVAVFLFPAYRLMETF